MIVDLGAKKIIAASVTSGWAAVRFRPIYATIVALAARRTTVASVESGPHEMIHPSLSFLVILFSLCAKKGWKERWELFYRDKGVRRNKL